MAQIKTWVVEEKDTEGKTVFRHEYTDHTEALGVYSNLVETHEDTFVSITKNDKRLLLE
jgi:hypothetical protein